MILSLLFGQQLSSSWVLIQFISTRKSLESFNLNHGQELVCFQSFRNSRIKEKKDEAELSFILIVLLPFFGLSGRCDNMTRSLSRGRLQILKEKKHKDRSKIGSLALGRLKLSCHY
ncbi:unnamed protein product [Vicia faba]|uniref:Uncharacterized protein n=1 Tax=Vicia faba TaxID=3906 RepID=A0AAV1AF43_VICFA|nr:unnamed protein product [Vicia faba]